MAIRRPNKPPKLATEVFDIKTSANDGGNGTLTSNTVLAGLVWSKGLTNGVGASFSRLTGQTQLILNSNAQQSAASWYTTDHQTGFLHTGYWATNSIVDYTFKRAPGVMDVVAYSGTVTGNSDSQTVAHNLGVTPELMFVKRRSGAADWYVYSNALTTPLTQKLVLNDVGGESSTSNAWGTSSSPTAPNANNFTVGYATATGWVTAGTFVAYLFATLPGVSKVGSYSGTGSALDINCGFTAGARFILIKRTNSSGDWYVWDSVRGIVSGNDPYFLLNTTAAQVTNTDYIDPLSTGFTVTSSAPAALNVSGGTYLFLAIA
jgi:hypothetical protein